MNKNAEYPVFCEPILCHYTANITFDNAFKKHFSNEYLTEF